MLNIAFCDDVKKDLGCIEKLLEEINCEKYNYDIFTSPTELISFISEKNVRFGLYFIALELQEMAGVMLAEEIRKIEKTALIVFVSQTKENIFCCLDSFLFYYLIKPIRAMDLSKIIKQAEDYLETSTKVFSFVWQGILYAIPCDQILYIELNLRQVIIHTTTGTKVGCLTMKESLKRADSKCFVQTHRKYTVNLKFVISVNKNEVEMADGQMVWLSRKRESMMKKRYKNFYNL